MKKAPFTDDSYDENYEMSELEKYDSVNDLDSFTEHIPQEMMGYASDRYDDDGLDEDLIRIED